MTRPPVKGNGTHEKPMSEPARPLQRSEILCGILQRMHSVVIRPAAKSDYETICALNLAAVQHTSPMDRARVADLGLLSCYFKVACVDGSVAAFLLAISSGAPYENDNFSWFTRRYPRFIYVDRIVAASAFRGNRLGSRLYQDLFRYAKHNAFAVVTCEYNVVPPNEPSRLFHDKFGFKEQGTQWLDGGAKQVSLQAAQT
jgi:predicted GNAT superfamily acetyltransferase